MTIKKISLFGLLAIFSWACSNLSNSSKGRFQKRIQRVTPNDVRNHTRKILVNKYQFQIEESEETASSIYLETSWKEVDLVEQEKKMELDDVRVRFRIRSRETRTGPEDTYNVHSLKFTADLEAYQTTNGNSTWSRLKITPQRKEYLDKIYSDYKLEFDTGVMNFN